MRNSKIIHRIKEFTTYFPSEHHFRPLIFNATRRFRILDILILSYDIPIGLLKFCF